MIPTRKLWSLYRNARLGGGAHDSTDAWTVEAHLLALVVDAVNALEWTLRAVNVKRPGKPPKPMPRPGAKKPTTSVIEGLPVVDLRGSHGGD